MSDMTLHLRPARAGDAEAVAAISAQIWEGEDYVPNRFHDWLAQEHGQLTVAYAGDELVGFGKLTRLAPGEWWLEGLRVDPAHRGRGVARALHDYAVSLADEVGSGTLRFGTAAGNAPVHQLAQNTGFTCVSRHLIVEAAAAPGRGDPTRLVPVTVQALPALRAWLQRSAHFAACHGLYEQRWTWYEMLPRLERLQAENRVYWWLNPAGQRCGVVLVQEPAAKPDLCYLDYLDVPAGQLTEALRALAAFASGRGRMRVKGKPAATDALANALAPAGWTVDELQLRLYERPLPHPRLNK